MFSKEPFLPSPNRESHLPGWKFPVTSFLAPPYSRADAGAHGGGRGDDAADVGAASSP